MAEDLPPPPARPVLPPPARLEGERPVTFPSRAQEVSLAGRLARRSGPRAVLVCHPHPLYGGTMDNAVVVAVCKTAGERGLTTLRFDFRGVGASTGRYDEGRGEADDVRGALDFARSQGAGEVDLVGYSFGAYAALSAVAAGEAVRSLALVAPAARIFDHLARAGGADALARLPGRPPRITVTVGDQDAYCTVEEARALAHALGAVLDVVAGADHFFMTGRRALAERVLAGLPP